MAAITDPSDALVSFKHAFQRKDLPLLKSKIHRSIRIMADEPEPGTHRLTYAQLDGPNVVGIAIYVPVEDHLGLPCFHAGLAISPEYRGRGMARSLLRASLNEMQQGMKRAAVYPFYVEAIIGQDNAASIKVTSDVFAVEPIAVTDELSGLPALQFMLKVEG